MSLVNNETNISLSYQTLQLLCNMVLVTLQIFPGCWMAEELVSWMNKQTSPREQKLGQSTYCFLELFAGTTGAQKCILF